MSWRGECRGGGGEGGKRKEGETHRASPFFGDRQAAERILQFQVDMRRAEADGRALGDRPEGVMGRDLQFIRINGTLVGGLVGMTLHALGAVL